MAITRFVLRWGLISGLALGGATLLLGPQKVGSALAAVRSKAQQVVDQCTDNPEALRRQLADLAEQYPDRIAEVRGEIAEVESTIAQFQRDVEIAKRVVALTNDDLGQLKTLVARAESRAATSTRPVALGWKGARYDIDEAFTEARRINQVKQTYRDRLAHDQQQLKFLQEQKERLSEIHAKLENDFSTYQAQLWQLDRQIDAIQRNERLIELTEQQQATLDSYDRFGRVGNLKQLESKLAELRTIQEAQLQALAKSNVGRNYEDIAQLELDGGTVIDEDPFADLFEVINLDDLEPVEVEEVTEASNSVAWAK